MYVFTCFRTRLPLIDLLQWLTFVGFPLLLRYCSIGISLPLNLQVLLPSSITTIPSRPEISPSSALLEPSLAWWLFPWSSQQLPLQMPTLLSRWTLAWKQQHLVQEGEIFHLLFLMAVALLACLIRLAKLVSLLVLASREPVDQLWVTAAQVLLAPNHLNLTLPDDLRSSWACLNGGEPVLSR